jgi:hypothetical protein
MKPARSPCGDSRSSPETVRPACAARRRRICRTASGCSAAGSTSPQRLTLRNTGPKRQPLASSQASSARTGQVSGLPPRGMPSSAPCPAELKRLIAANRQAASADALASNAAGWVLGLTPRQARRKAGMASKHFWLKKLVQDFWLPTRTGETPKSMRRLARVLGPDEPAPRASILVPVRGGAWRRRPVRARPLALPGGTV